jgi:hypothetical protein
MVEPAGRCVIEGRLGLSRLPFRLGFDFEDRSGHLPVGPFLAEVARLDPAAAFDPGTARILFEPSFPESALALAPVPVSPLRIIEGRVLVARTINMPTSFGLVPISTS